MDACDFLVPSLSRDDEYHEGSELTSWLRRLTASDPFAHFDADGNRQHGAGTLAAAALVH